MKSTERNERSVARGADSVHVWKRALNELNKQSQTSEKRLSSSTLVERVAYNPFLWLESPYWARASLLSRLHTLDEWSALGRELYLTKYNIHKRHTSMPPAGFEPAIPVSDRPQIHVSDRAATGFGLTSLCLKKLSCFEMWHKTAGGAGEHHTKLTRSIKCREFFDELRDY